jgi:nickel/cobalt transporter (NicO) family protein
MNYVINGISRRKYWFWLILLLGIVTVSAIVLIPWGNIPGAIAVLQKQLHLLLTEHISRVESAPWQYGTSLIMISFLYGVFHAIGPGHGKAVIVGYLGTQKSEQISHGIKISFLASLLQAIVAIVLVTGIAQLLNLSLGAVKQYGASMEIASYILVILLGTVIILRAIRRLYNQRSRNVGKHSHQHSEMKHSCGCQHSYTPDSKQDVRQRGLVILSMGLRPCTGALIVLMYAYVVNVYAFGITATLAMGIGTGLAIAILACATILFRDRLVKWMERDGENRRESYLYLGSGLMLLGGVILVALGLSLLMVTSAVSVNHPLL